MTKTHNKITKTWTKIEMKMKNTKKQNWIQSINKNYNSISVILK